MKKRAVGASRPRVLYFDALRAVAPIFVVFIHAVVTFWGHSTGTHLIQEIGRWAVPIFFMISGALLLNPGKKFDIRTFYRKNILRLVLALVVWILVYGILGFFLLSASHASRGYQLGLNLAGKVSYHLWFMYAIIALYLLTPILRYVATNRKILRYLLLLGVMVCFVLPMIVSILELIAVWTGNSFLNGYLAGKSDPISSLSGALKTLGYVTFYVLGYYLASERLSGRERFTIYLFGIIGFIEEFVWILARERTLGNVDAAPYIFLPVLCTSAAIFVMAQRLLRKKKQLPRLVNFMAKYSFGVYLIHLAWLIFVLKPCFGQTVQSWPWVVAMPLMALVTYALSLISVWILSNIPFLRRIV